MTNTLLTTTCFLVNRFPVHTFSLADICILHPGMEKYVSFYSSSRKIGELKEIILDSEYVIHLFSVIWLELYSLNAPKIGLVNVPPLGFLPIERTLCYFESK